MTLTLEIAPEIEAALQTEAQRNGQSVNDYAAQVLSEALEDAQDVAEAERRMGQSDPSKRRSLDELRSAVYGDQKAA